MARLLACVGLGGGFCGKNEMYNKVMYNREEAGWTFAEEKITRKRNFEGTPENESGLANTHIVMQYITYTA